jgi:N-acetylglucosaminyldiphosphoundecaprenol N-acetyl-beta-D-mannosaminyltransferase
MMDHGKREVLGVRVDAVDMPAALDRVLLHARNRRPCAVSALAVHGVMEAQHDDQLRSQLNDFDLVLPDGQPVRWALNLLHGLELPDKVPGPSIVDRLLEAAADEGLITYFYGSTPATQAAMRTTLDERFGGRLAMVMSPSRFRPLDRSEVARVVEDINASGAHLCFVGLGCPRQERFVAEVAPQLDMPALAVGAAFDYLAGTIRRAPRLVQRTGLEWAYRARQDPRLVRRYATTNGAFLVALAQQLLRTRVLRQAPSFVPAFENLGPAEHLDG